MGTQKASGKAPVPRVPMPVRRSDYAAGLISVALASTPPGVLPGGVCIFFPHRTEGEPPLAALLSRQLGDVFIGGHYLDGRPFTLTPDPPSSALIRAEIEKADRRYARDLDPETGLPVW